MANTTDAKKFAINILFINFFCCTRIIDAIIYDNKKQWYKSIKPVPVSTVEKNEVAGSTPKTPLIVNDTKKRKSGAKNKRLFLERR